MTLRKKPTHSTPSAARVRPPRELQAAVVSLEGEEFALFEWPMASMAVRVPLTPAEREVTELLLAGESNAEIAARRGTHIATVAKQVASIFSKLGVRSRLELFALASAGARG